MYITYNNRLKNFSQEFRNKPTIAEEAMWKYLKWQFPELKFNRQKPLDNFVVDFYCKQHAFVIEVDGEIHDEHKERDKARDEILKFKHGLLTLRFTNHEVLNDQKQIKQKLKDFLAPLFKGACTTKGSDRGIFYSILKT